MRYKTFNIKYDTDGETVADLPTEIIFSVNPDDSVSELSSSLNDMISDRAGWPASSFEFKEINT